MDYSAAMLGFKQFQLAYAALKIGLPALLAKGPRTGEQIARATGIPLERLARLIQGLIWCDILRQTETKAYALTAAGSELVDDRPRSISEDLRFHGEFHYRAYGELVHYLQTGQIPFTQAHGIGIFDSISADPRLAKLYTSEMGDRCSDYSPAIAALPQLNGAQTIMDIAGGTGQLLVDILRIRPDARGIVFDLPYMQAAVEGRIQETGLSGRCTFQTGDIFKSIPAGIDVYLLKWILHDFTDDQSRTILRNISEAMSPSSRLLIIERLMPQTITPETDLIEGDLNMLCLSGGAERTLEAYRELCAAAGLELRDSIPVDTYYGFHAMTVVRGA